MSRAASNNLANKCILTDPDDSEEFEATPVRRDPHLTARWPSFVAMATTPPTIRMDYASDVPSSCYGPCLTGYVHKYGYKRSPKGGRAGGNANHNLLYTVYCSQYLNTHGTVRINV